MLEGPTPLPRAWSTTPESQPSILLSFSAPAPLLIGAAAPREDVMLEPSPLFYKCSRYFSLSLLSLSLSFLLFYFSLYFIPPSTTLPTTSSSARLVLPSFYLLLVFLIKRLSSYSLYLVDPSATSGASIKDKPGMFSFFLSSSHSHVSFCHFSF